MKRIVAYYRVSTEKQGRSGLGLEAQQAAIQSFASDKRADIIKRFTEIETGKTADRPELCKALALAKRTRATLVIAKLDRLARNVHFTSGLLESGVDFVACDMPEADRTMIHVYATFAEHEARRISERTKAALAAVKRRGVKLGSARPGHWKGREHLRLKGAKAGAKKAGELRRQKASETYDDVKPVVMELHESGLSLRKIAARLNDEGYHTQTGKPWNPMRVRYVLQLATATV